MALAPDDKGHDGGPSEEKQKTTSTPNPPRVGEWTEVLRTKNPYRAELVRAVLEEHYIPAVVLSQRDSSYHSFGNQRVLVPDDLHAKALEILASDVVADEDADIDTDDQ